MKNLLIKLLSVAVALTASAAIAEIGDIPTIPLIKSGIDTSNLRQDTEAWRTYIHPSTDIESTEADGFIRVDLNEGVVMPGAQAYSYEFKKKGNLINGCIRSSDVIPLGDPEETVLCSDDPDGGKRIKSHHLTQDAPLDFVFNFNPDTTDVGHDPLTPNILKYWTFFKLINDTAGRAKGFQASVGTGIGDNFQASTATDHLKFLPPGNPEKLGKFPGGLFGGSKSEGLPFFTTTIAGFQFTVVGDTATTNAMPDEYTSHFGDWMTVNDVPNAWVFDFDGKPWTGNKMVAWDDKYDDGFTDGWWTYEKSWADKRLDGFPPLDGLDANELRNLVLADFNIDPGDVNNPVVFTTENIPALLFPPENELAFIDQLTDLVNELTNRANKPAGKNGPYKSQDVAFTLAQNFLLLTRDTTEPAAFTANWQTDPLNLADHPVTLRYNTTWEGTDPGYEDEALDLAMWPVIATWHPDCEVDDAAVPISFFGPYVIDMDVLATLEPEDAAEFDGKIYNDITLDCDGTPLMANIAIVEEVKTIVKNNTGVTSPIPGEPDTNIFAIPGYYEDVLEDLANSNVFFGIAFNKDLIKDLPADEPFTIRLTLGDPLPPTTPPTTDDGDDAVIKTSSDDDDLLSCSYNSGGGFDPVFPALILFAMAYLSLRRKEASSSK